MSAVPMRDDIATAETEDELEALSAFMDDEADIPAILKQSASAHRHWDTYHLIGDVLRTDELACPASPRFMSQLRQALADEPAIVAPRRRPVRRFITRYAAPGAALAAVVVAVTWIAQPYIAPSGTLQASVKSQPRGAMMSASLPVNPALLDYFDAHRHMAGIGGSVGQAALDVGQP